MGIDLRLLRSRVKFRESLQGTRSPKRVRAGKPLATNVLHPSLTLLEVKINSTKSRKTIPQARYGTLGRRENESESGLVA